jgi:hypothetical protein
MRDLKTSILQFTKYLEQSETNFFEYKFSIYSSPSPFSRCFAIFSLNLINKLSLCASERSRICKLIRCDLDNLYASRKVMGYNMQSDKVYLQLLTFSLTSLKIIDSLNEDGLEDHCLRLIPENVSKSLDKRKVNFGVPQSGNYAMFIAIVLLHTTRFLNQNHSAKIDEWISYHFKHMNQFGFWGNYSSMSHLQFQNGYHQYEILDYLAVDNPNSEKAADSVASLADYRGRFSPYLGGGACYDYDAVAIITMGGENLVSRHLGLLKNTQSSILDDQNEDGGFCDSQFIRPRSFSNFFLSIRHTLDAKGLARKERLRQSLTLLRPKYNRFLGAGHWTVDGYNRRWNESNLWDSYFRMSAIARIALTLDPDAGNQWSFVDYPGIGYHETLRRQDG